MLSRHTLEGALAQTENQMREVFGKDKNKNKLAAPPLAATNINLFVFHARARTARTCALNEWWRI
jgi:hypothetical protein